MYFCKKTLQKYNVSNPFLVDESLDSFRHIFTKVVYIFNSHPIISLGLAILFHLTKQFLAFPSLLRFPKKPTSSFYVQQHLGFPTTWLIFIEMYTFL